MTAEKAKPRTKKPSLRDSGGSTHYSRGDVLAGNRTSKLPHPGTAPCLMTRMRSVISFDLTLGLLIRDDVKETRHLHR